MCFKHMTDIEHNVQKEMALVVCVAKPTEYQFGAEAVETYQQTTQTETAMMAEMEVQAVKGNLANLLNNTIETCEKCIERKSLTIRQSK